MVTIIDLCLQSQWLSQEFSLQLKSWRKFSTEWKFEKAIFKEKISVLCRNEANFCKISEFVKIVPSLYLCPGARPQLQVIIALWGGDGHDTFLDNIYLIGCSLIWVCRAGTCCFGSVLDFIWGLKRLEKKNMIILFSS